MSSIIKNNNKQNIEETDEDIFIMKDYNYIKKSSNSIKNKNKIKLRALKLLREIDKKKQNNSIFLTSEKKPQHELKTERNRRRKNSLINSYNHRGIKALEDFNVFNNEDKFIKDLMEKFNNKTQKRISKTEKKKKVLNKLYGIDPLYNKRMKIAKRNKKLPLEEYQANTFKILTTNNIGKTELYDLAFNLKNLRQQSDSVSPLPPIKMNIIYDHVYQTNNYKEKKKILTVKQLIYENNEPKDEFEKEEKLIKQMMSYKALQRGKRNKAFDILPEYLKSALSKRFKKNI